MADSSSITRVIANSPNPREAEFEIFKKTRYFIAQFPAMEGDTTTCNGYYNGCVVIPGPKAHRAAGVVGGNDFNIMRNTYHIRFVDNNTTDGADERVRKAIFRPMTKAEADDYDAKVFEKLAEGLEVKPQQERTEEDEYRTVEDFEF